MKSAIRGLTRLAFGILVEGTSPFLRELKRNNPVDYAIVDPEVLRKYVERQGEPAFNGIAARDIKPEQLLADSHNGSNKCLATGERTEWRSPPRRCRPKGPKQGKLKLEHYVLDDEGRVATCPATH